MIDKQAGDADDLWECIYCGEKYYPTTFFRWCSDECQKSTLREERNARMFKKPTLYSEVPTVATNSSEPTKQAGDVKRYEINHPYDQASDLEVSESPTGSWVKASDIAHLLKPQEPTSKSEMKRKNALAGRPIDEGLRPQEPNRCKHGVHGDDCYQCKPPAPGIACLNGHDLVGYVKCGYCFEKLEAENRRLIDLLNASKETR